MRARSIVAAISIGATVVVVGPLAEPASAAVTATSSGTTATITMTGDESVDFRCVSGNLSVGWTGGVTAVSPALACSAVTQVTVNGDGGDQNVYGSDLNAAAFSAGPKLIASLNSGNDFLSETRRADTISLGPDDDWVDLQSVGVANASVDVGSGTNDYVAVNGTPGNDSITATSTNATLTVAVTYAGGSANHVVTNGERLKVAAAAGNDTITTTGVTAASTIDDGSYEAGLGDDTITDGVIDSYLHGGAGTNILTGGDGQDSYWSASHTDTLNGASDAHNEWIYDTDGLRSGGRTLNGFTALDTYTVQAHQGDVTMRIRPGAGGTTLFTTSLTRSGQQVVPAAIGRLTGGQAYSGSLAHRGLIDVVATNDAVTATLPNVGNLGLIDVTIPSGSFTAELTGTNLLVTSSYGQINASYVPSADRFRVHGPWTNEDQGFAHRVYRDLLFRFLTDTQRDQLRDQLTNGTVTRSAVAGGIVNSDEYRGLDVDRVFLKYLRRVADPTGRTYWINSIRNGKALWRFRAQLFGSSEYFAKAGGTNAAYVESAYRDVLGRSPDPSGKAYWTNKLNNGADRGSVALQFINSPEARRRLVDDQFLRFLDRLPTAEEQSTWVAALPGTTGEQDMIRSLVSGASYYNRS